MTTWVGIDVAKHTHWVCAVDRDARVLRIRAVQNTQADLDALAAELRALPSPVLVGLDIDGSLAAFLPAVLLAEDIALVHVPGLTVNRAAHGYTGGARKSDPQDIRVVEPRGSPDIADLVRTRPELRLMQPMGDVTATLRLLVSRFCQGLCQSLSPSEVWLAYKAAPDWRGEWACSALSAGRPR